MADLAVDRPLGLSLGRLAAQPVGRSPLGSSLDWSIGHLINDLSHRLGAVGHWIAQSGLIGRSSIVRSLSRSLGRLVFGLVGRSCCVYRPWALARLIGQPRNRSAAWPVGRSPLGSPLDWSIGHLINDMSHRLVTVGHWIAQSGLIGRSSHLAVHQGRSLTRSLARPVHQLLWQ